MDCIDAMINQPVDADVPSFTAEIAVPIEKPEVAPVVAPKAAPKKKAVAKKISKKASKKSVKVAPVKKASVKKTKPEKPKIQKMAGMEAFKWSLDTNRKIVSRRPFWTTRKLSEGCCAQFVWKTDKLKKLRVIRFWPRRESGKKLTDAQKLWAEGCVKEFMIAHGWEEGQHKYEVDAPAATDLDESQTCKEHGCFRKIFKKGPYCRPHQKKDIAERIKCKTTTCQRTLLKSRKGIRGLCNYCLNKCAFPGCTKLHVGGTHYGEFCTAHGGGYRCTHPGCMVRARTRANPYCAKHGGTSKCKISGCTRKSIDGQFCVPHGKLGRRGRMAVSKK